MSNDSCQGLKMAYITSSIHFQNLFTCSHPNFKGGWEWSLPVGPEKEDEIRFAKYLPLSLPQTPPPVSGYLWDNQLILVDSLSCFWISWPFFFKYSLVQLYISTCIGIYGYIHNYTPVLNEQIQDDHHHLLHWTEYVPPKFVCWNSNSQCDGFRRWGLLGDD